MNIWHRGIVHLNYYDKQLNNAGRFSLTIYICVILCLQKSTGVIFAASFGLFNAFEEVREHSVAKKDCSLVLMYNLQGLFTLLQFSGGS